MHRAFGFRINLDAQRFRQFVFGDQPDRQYQRIAFYDLFRTGERLHFIIYFCDLYGGQAIVTEYARDRMGEIQRDVVVMQALVDVARESRGRGLCFVNAQNFCALQRKPPSHNKTDVAAAQNNTSLRRKLA